MIRTFATAWIFLVLLIAPVFAEPVCKRALFSQWLTPPEGYRFELGYGDGYAYLKSNHDTHQEVYILRELRLHLDDTTLLYETIGKWIDLSFPDVEWCREPDSDMAGPVTSQWVFIGWDYLNGGPPEGGPRPGGPQGYGELIVLQHSVHAMGTGALCNCGSGGGGGSGGDSGGNTNQFHLDVTNSLSSIQSTLGVLTNGLNQSTTDARATEAGEKFNGFVAAVTNLLESNPAWDAFKEEGNIDASLPDVPVSPHPWFLLTVAGQVFDIGLLLDSSISSSSDLIGILRTIVAFTAVVALFLTITWENKNVVLSLMQSTKGTVIGRNTAAAVPGLGVAVASVVVLSVITLIITIPTWMAFTGLEVFPKFDVDPAQAAALYTDPSRHLVEMFVDAHGMWAQLWLRFVQFVPVSVFVTAFVNYALYLRVQNTVQILFYAIMKHIPV